MLKKLAILLRNVSLALAIALVGLWGCGALYFASLPVAGLDVVAAVLFGAAALTASLGAFSKRYRWRALLFFAPLVALFAVWWSTIEPSLDGDWLPEVAQLPYAEIEGDIVTVHNVRNFDYRSQTDFTPRYETRAYDLRRLRGVDLFSVYWMGPDIAHVILSFDFGDGQPLAISIEARKRRGQGYSSLRGFFRQYELIYIVADERDVIRLRTNYRLDPPEEVYRYRLAAKPEKARRIFLEYLKEINELRDTPAFYNTLITNCTTQVWFISRINTDHVPFSWKLLASGHVPEYLYEQGRLDTSVPFEQLRERGHINARARAVDDIEDFSRAIRVATPAP